MTVHAESWFWPKHAICGVKLGENGREVAKVPMEVECNVCAEWLLGHGRVVGLDVTKTDSWTFDQLKRCDCMDCSIAGEPTH